MDAARRGTDDDSDVDVGVENKVRRSIVWFSRKLVVNIVLRGVFEQSFKTRRQENWAQKIHRFLISVSVLKSIPPFLVI